MSNTGVMSFVRDFTYPEDVAGKVCLEVGSLEVAGTSRHDVLNLKPAKYIGVDMVAGPCVDEICDVYCLTERYGENVFDYVMSTEMLEHVCDWRKAISQMKRVCKEGGILILTTRSEPYHWHGHPLDFWRYSQEDFRRIFNDCEILMEGLDNEPGLMIKLRKPVGFKENNLDDVKLFNINSGMRQL